MALLCTKHLLMADGGPRVMPSQKNAAHDLSLIKNELDKLAHLIRGDSNNVPQIT